MVAGVRWETIGAIFAAIIVLALRMRRMAKEQKLNRRRLWILPILLVGVLAMVTIAAPPPAYGFAIMAVAIVVGGLIGWKRGQMIRIWKDWESGDWMQQASPAAILLLGAVILIKLGLRLYMGSPTVPDAGAPPHETALIASDALLGFVIALVSMTRIEMALRCKKMAEGQAE